MKKVIITIALLTTTFLSAQSDLFDGKFIKGVFVESFESTNAARLHVGYEVMKYPELADKLKKVVGIKQAWIYGRYSYRIESGKWFNHDKVVQNCIDIISNHVKKISK